MIKKLIMLAMAVAALAAIVPAVASASQLTSGGHLVEEGTEITLTNDPFNPLTMEIPALGTDVTCEKFKTNVEVAKNNGDAFAGGPGATGSTENCEFEGVAPFEVIDPAVMGINSATTGTGEVMLSFEVIVAGAHCQFETVGPGVFHYELPSSSKVTLTEMELFSPACGELFISGSLTAETRDGTPVVLE